MTDLEYIVENLSDEDILCQISEEADELAKAALKLRRAITGTNPTPVTVDEAVENFIAQVGKAYETKIGYAADFYVVEIGDGPQKLA